MELRLQEHGVTLHGAKVTLRPMTEHDWDVLARWGSDPEVLWFSEGDHVESYSLQEVQGIYREVSLTAFCFIIMVEGRRIGEGWLQRMNLDKILSRYPAKDCRRIDLTLGEKDSWGQGYGTDTIRALTAFGFEQENADMIFGCGVADYNPRSRRAFERAGFVELHWIETPVGCKARWLCDLVVTREDYLLRSKVHSLPQTMPHPRPS